ncbi:hypothetical protein, partial [Streptomyces prunicolor]|uniref:hypothetical protein n=1 Tax=Streptomyces prunicolor TaxID=67348 RepID=UPI0033F17855
MPSRLVGPGLTLVAGDRGTLEAAWKSTDGGRGWGATADVGRLRAGGSDRPSAWMFGAAMDTIVWR